MTTSLPYRFRSLCPIFFLIILTSAEFFAYDNLASVRHNINGALTIVIIRKWSLLIFV